MFDNVIATKTCVNKQEQEPRENMKVLTQGLNVCV